MTTLNKSNFFQTVQYILETYYLKPLDGSEKSNLKDGFIERTVHGATHASRAAIWALAMHHFLQNISPDFVNESMDNIARHLNIDTEELLLLILITMVCHDAGRKGEGQDLWEKKSANITCTILIELGLDTQHAKLFALAIQSKDKPQAYAMQLQQLGIELQNCNAFDYIRSIINLGDNLDLMRCVGDFESTFIFNTLKNIKGFNETLHAFDVMQLLQAIHQIIHNQGDMLFACAIRDTTYEIAFACESHISTKEKVSYEHADNVMAVLFEDIAQNPLLYPLLSGLDVPKAQKYALKTAFDPFIHGTNSSIFSILPKSNFEIMSPIDMMRDHQAAPMTGELTQGGYRTIETKYLGQTSFAKLSSQGYYTLNRVMASYTYLTVGSPAPDLLLFKTACDKGFSQSYLNINLILIYFVRARQSHQSLDQVISAQELELLFAKMEASYQFYYLIQLLGTHIFPNVSELNKYRIMQQNVIKRPKFSDEATQMSMACDNFLTYENLVHKILVTKLDIKAIFENPTQEQLKKVLDILEVPTKCTLKNRWGEIKYNDIELPLTQFFTLNPSAFEYALKHYEQGVFCDIQQNNSGNSNCINQLLTQFIEGYATNELFIHLSFDAQKHAEAFYERMQLFKQLANTPQNQFTITDVQSYFLDREFPIILLSDTEDKIAIISFSTEEYRSHSNLKFGTDIKLIATDTNFHRLEVLKYLERHNINTVQVVLFNDLETIKTTHQKIASPQHHSDCVPTLKWMAARQVPKSDIQSISEDSPLLLKKYGSSQQLGSEKNVTEVSALLHDAKTYHEIVFEPCCVYRCKTPSHHVAVEILVKAGIDKQTFASLIDYHANNSLLVEVIVYLSELNLPQMYKKALEDSDLSTVLGLFMNANIKEGITEDFLNNSSIIQLLTDRRFYHDNSYYFQAIMALHKHLPNCEDFKLSKISNYLAKLIIYFDNNALQKYFAKLLDNREIDYSFLKLVERNTLSNEIISAIFDDKNILQAIGKHYINSKEDLETAFILSKLGIEINFSITCSLRSVVSLLKTHNFTDKSYYIEAISSKEVIDCLSDFAIKTPFHIHAVLKANEFGILATEFNKITLYPQLAKMLAFATNQDEWLLYREFFDLLDGFTSNQYIASIDSKAYDVSLALLKDINQEIDTCFSFANTDPNKMKTFSVKTNQLIEAARAILELNTGLFGALDASLLFFSNFQSKPSTNHTNYSFFKNESAKLIETIQATLVKMGNEGSSEILQI